MSFTPIVPMSGYAGWAFLQRTIESQKEAFAASPVMQKDEDYFRAKIGSVGSAEELVSDRRLLKVALGAFGLDADINNTFFIRKVLEEGSSDRGALANRLSDKSYLALSKAFGFGETTTPGTARPGFADGILATYAEKQFELAVGDQNNDMRLALNAQRELAALGSKDTTETAKWYTVLGSGPLREVFETAFNLPSAFASLDLDQQVRELQSKMNGLLGSKDISTFAEPAQVDTMIKRFLTMAQISGSGATATAPALQILQSGGSAGGILSLLI